MCLLYVCLPVCQSAYLSVLSSAHIALHQSISLSIFYMFVCMSVGLSPCPYISRSVICPYFHLSACLSVYLSLSIFPTVCPSLHLSVFLSMIVSVCLCVCPSVQLSSCLFTYLSSCLSIYGLHVCMFAIITDGIQLAQSLI